MYDWQLLYGNNRQLLDPRWSGDLHYIPYPPVQKSLSYRRLIRDLPFQWTSFRAANEQIVAVLASLSLDGYG